MRTLAALLFLVSDVLLHAQSAGDLQLLIDPPGDMQYASYIDGTVTATGEVYFLGGYQNVPESAFTLAKFTATGQLIWSRKVETTAPDLGMEARKVMVDANDQITVFGYLGTGSGLTYFLLRMTSDGILVWNRNYMPAGGGNDYGSSTAQMLEDGGVVMSIGLESKAIMVRLDTDGNVDWCRNFITTDNPTGKNPGFEPAITPDGGALITAKAENDMYLVRIDGTGSVQWSNRYPTGHYTHTKTALSLPDGGFMVAGVSGTLPFAARLDISGNLVWNKQYNLDEGWIEWFNGIQPLPNGGFLLSPSRSSLGVMGVRITATGDPVEVALIDGNGTANVIGSLGDKVVMVGRTMAAVDGGFQDMFMLLKLNADLGMTCLRANSGAWTVDQPLTEPPVPGCSSMDELLIGSTFPVVVSNVTFTTRELCASLTGVAEHGRSQELRVYPSPVSAGTAISVDLSEVKDVTRVECIASDGRLLRTEFPAAGAQQLTLDTKGLPQGIHLIRTVDRDGRSGRTARFVVE